MLYNTIKKILEYWMQSSQIPGTTWYLYVSVVFLRDTFTVCDDKQKFKRCDKFRELSVPHHYDHSF